MTAADLPARIRAAIDETERLARALDGEGWNAHDEAHGMRRVTVNYSTETVVACTLARRGEHIARHDPAAVLRRCAADRRILERHAPYVTPATRYIAERVQCEYCVSLCHSRSGLGCDDPYDAPWPCPDIRDLADAYGVEVEG